MLKSQLWLRRLVYGILGCCAVLWTSPLWLPKVLPSVLKQFDLTVEAMLPTDSGNWLFKGVTYETDGLRLEADVIEVPSLLGYFRAYWTRAGASSTEIRAGVLEFELKRPEENLSALESRTVEPLVVTQWMEKGLALIEKRLPSIQINTVTLRSLEGRQILKGSQLDLREGRMDGWIESSYFPERVWAHVAIDGEMPWRVELNGSESGLTLKVILGKIDDGFSMDGHLSQGDQRIEGFAAFGGQAWLPRELVLRSEGFSIDGRWLPEKNGWKLVDGQLEQLFLSYQGEHYEAMLRSTAVYLDQAEKRLPFDLDLSFSGDLEAVSMDRCTLSAGFGEVTLSRPTTFSIKERRVDQDTQLSAQLDLAKQPFIEAGGRIDAEIKVVSFSGIAEPDIWFDLAVHQLEYQHFKANRLEASGSLEGDDLKISELLIHPEDNGQIEIKGQVNLASQALDLAYAIKVHSDWLNASLEVPYFLGEFVGSGHVGGDLQCPQIKGWMDTVTFQSDQLEPVEATGSFQMFGWNEIKAKAHFACDQAVIETDCSVFWNDGSSTLMLNTLRWSDPERPELRLESPLTIRYQHGDLENTFEKRVSIEPFHFSGEDIDLIGEWSESKGFHLNLRNLSLERLNRWIRFELPAYTLQKVDLSLSKWRPQLEGTARVYVENEMNEHARLGILLDSHFDGEGLFIDEVNVAFSGTSLLSGRISLPLRFQLPSEGVRFWELVKDGMLSGTVTGSSEGSFPDWVREVTGIQIGAAHLDLALEGSLEQPVGEMTLRVETIRSERFSMPTLDQVEMVAKAKSGRVEVPYFGFNKNQSNAASGTLSFPVEALLEALEKTDADGRKKLLSQSRGRIELTDWKVENWVDQLPAMMRQSGLVSGSVELDPGLDLKGEVVFDDFALRPTPSFPSVDQIRGDVVLSDRKLTIKNATARMLESTIDFEGWLDLRDWSNPLWDFRLSGDNVPLVRTTDMILRSDLAIRVKHEEKATPPVVSGFLNLRSSTLLVAFDPLAPSLEGGPKRRPPFFSIKEPAIADWRFDLDIEGDSFMQVRSPYFRTELSANLVLGGSFREPELVGSIRTVNGELRFPGSKMSIESGEAHITPDRLDELQLNIRGTSQKASYIVTMEVTQTLEEPQVHFQSSPPLSNASIIRLLATGSTTGGGVGTVGLYLGQGLLGSGGMDDGYADRLTIDVGAETSRSGRNTLNARLDLTDSLYLNGEYDVHDAYNLDFVWSIFRE